MISQIQMMEIALSAYMLLGSTSIGYLLIRMGYPQFRTLETTYKTGWSIITGMIFVVTTIILGFLLSFLLNQRVTAFELFFIVPTCMIMSSIIAFNVKRYYVGSNRVKVSVPKRAVAASVVAKKAIEKLGPDAYISDREAAKSLQEIVNKIDRGEIAIKVDKASNLIPLTEEEKQDKNVQEVLSKKVLLIGPPQKIEFQQKLEEQKKDKEQGEVKEDGAREIIAKLKNLVQKNQKNEGMEKRGVMKVPAMSEESVKEKTESKRNLSKILVGEKTNNIEESLKSLKSLVEESEKVEEAKKKDLKVLVEETKIQKPKISAKPETMIQKPVEAIGKPVEESKLKKPVRVRETEETTQKVLEDISKKIGKGEEKIVNEDQIRKEVEETKRYIIENLKKDLVSKETKPKGLEQKPKVFLRKSAKVLQELLSER